ITHSAALVASNQHATISGRGGAGAADALVVAATSAKMGRGTFVSALMSVATRHDVPQSQGEDAQIEPQRPILDVIEIILYPLAKIAAATQIVHLRPSGDACLDHVLLHVPGDLLSEAGHEFRPFRPWSHQRHLAGEDVEQLRELVDTEASQPCSEACGSAVAAMRPHRPAALLCVHPHRAELEHGKRAAVPGDALLQIQ